jgi:glyoxylase-like metal-dependent hydrolase (beta-lactamase superfamily II)
MPPNGSRGVTLLRFQAEKQMRMTMNRRTMHRSTNVYHRFTVGLFDCMVVSDGARMYPWRLFSGSVSPTVLAATLSAHQLRPTAFSAPTTCLVVNTGQHLVLVDAGAGMHTTTPTLGKLLDNLRAGGIAPEDIDTVILTHAHPGHAGGVYDDSGRLSFPNARYVLWREEWEFWSAIPDLTRRNLQSLVTSAGACLDQIHERLDLVERNADVVPGISLIAAPGHSAGHSALAISSEDERLLCLGDAVFHPIHLEYPDWFSTLDLRPEQSVTSRLRLLDRAVGEDALVHAAHFPFPGLGHVQQEGDAWRWQPLAPITAPRARTR